MKLVLFACSLAVAVAYPYGTGVVWDGKFGDCPVVTPGELMCVELDSCETDLDCTGTKKCCNSPCDKGNVCLHPVVTDGTEKPGQCPVPTQQPEDLCTNPDVTVCQTDVDCTSVQKCCDTECGDRRCLIPTDVDEVIEAKWKTFIGKKKEYFRRLQNFPPPPYFFQKLYNNTDNVRMCTSTIMEWKKCQRMANEFTYTLQPKREWGCALATSQEHCMFWLQQDYVDVMVTRDEDTFTAKTTYNLRPVAYEVPYTVTESKTTSTLPIFKEWQNVTLAIAPLGTTVETWSELAGTTTCHAHANATSAFKAPICSLIKKDVIPRKGDYVESASEFFTEMCVPDILTKTFNKNETYPENLIARCPETEQQRQYEGIEGSLKCIDDTKAKVTFVDHKVIQDMITTPEELEAQGLPVTRQVENYKLICQDRSYPLTDWQVKSCHVSMTAYPTVFMTPKKDDVWKTMLQDILKDVVKVKSCHVSMTAYPTVFMTPKKDDEWKTTLQDILKDVVKTFTSKSKQETTFRVFESSPYTCTETNQPGTNLIFLDDTKNFTMITDEDTYVEEFFDTFKTCNELQAKPRAKFCVTTQEQLTHCLDMKKYFDKTDKVRDIAWGCINATTDMECMKTILNGTADLMTTDAMKTFIAGQDFKLQPIISQFMKKEVDEQTYDWKTYTYTIGVMKKSVVTERFGENTRYINLTKLNTCHAGVNKISSFQHPIGWLLANGTIPRIGSVFESVSRFFENTCLPGADPATFRWDQDLVLGHEVNWGIPGLHFFNFTEPEWFIWNSPRTWNYFNWQGTTPSFFRMLSNVRSLIMKNTQGTNPEFDPSAIPEMFTDGRIDINTLSTLIDQLPTELGSQLRDAQQFVTKMKTRQTTDQIERSWTRQGRRMQGRQTIADRISNIIPDSSDPTVSKMWSQILKMRFNAIDQVEEMITLFQDIPTMTNTQNEETTWLKHPAVQSFLQVYTPQLLGYFTEIFDNNELRQREFSRYANPIWLSPTYNDFLEVTQTHQKKLCESCIGYETDKCTLENEPYSDYRGSLNCLKDNSGDIVFVESHTLDKLVEDISELSFNNLVLFCPTGEVIDYVKGDVDIVKQCNFGRVPQPVLVTAFNKTGSYRWNVTKALLYAQQVFSHHHQNTYNFKMFAANSVFDPKTTKLYPINLINQTYAPWLGPMFLRSMEALVKPSSFDWWKNHSQACWGETYTNVLTQRNGTCNTMVKDVTCAGTPPNKIVYVGRIGEKQKKMVKMCSRPTRFTRNMAEFLCDNGDSYLKTVMAPTACECVPCEEITVSMSWNKDYFWTRDDREFIQTTVTTDEPILWGNDDFWADNTLNPNFNLKEEFRIDTTPITETTNESNTVRDTTQSCEAPWTGDTWRKEWFPESGMPMCRLPGLTTEQIIEKMINRWN